VDGLLTKINFDFLQNLKRQGLIPYNIRVKYVSRDSKQTTALSLTFATLEKFDAYHATVLNLPRYLCSAGNFPVIQNMEIRNTNLSFINTYAWYDITASKRLVKTIQRDPTRQAIYESQSQKYVDLQRKSIDIYAANVKKGISDRLNSYVDPCYVDSGYVSPNHT
jgi:hypothetical protein